MPSVSLPSDLELQALSVLYGEGPSTVAIVLGNLADRKERAYTTILSVMQSLERKGLVKATREGRAYIYKPTKSQASIVSPLAKDFVLNAFGGSIGHAILHLLSIGAMTPEEKSAVERELKKHRAMAAKKKTTKRRKTAAKRKPARRKVAKRKPAKKAAKRKAAKRKPAKKAAKKKAAKRKPAKKAAKKAAKRAPAKRAKKAAKKKAAKKAARRRPAKRAKKKAAAKRRPAKKAAKKKVAKRKAARKRR